MSLVSDDLVILVAMETMIHVVLCCYDMVKFHPPPPPPTGLILGLRPANEKRRYFVTTFLIGWAHS